jgi:hypothetical protein
MTVGQEFGGWASLVERDIERLGLVLPGLLTWRSAARPLEPALMPILSLPSELPQR